MKCKISKIPANKNKKIKTFLNCASLKKLKSPIVDKQKKQIKWLIDVPIGLAIIFGCVERSLYKKYPIMLPGNKYKIKRSVIEM